MCFLRRSAIVFHAPVFIQQRSSFSSCSLPDPALISDSFLVFQPEPRPILGGTSLPLLPVHLFHHALAQRSSQLPRILPTLGQVGNPSPSHTTSTTTTRQAGVPPLLLLFHLHSSSHCLLPITTCSNLYITANQNAGVFPIHHRWCRGPY